MKAKYPSMHTCNLDKIKCQLDPEYGDSKINSSFNTILNQVDAKILLRFISKQLRNVLQNFTLI